MAIPDPQPASAPPSEKPERRWTDRSILPPLFRDLGNLLGIIGMFVTAVYWVNQTQAGSAYSQKVIEDLRQENRDLRRKNEEQDEKLKLLPAIEKWVACQEKAADTGQKQNFYWSTLECVPTESPSNLTPTGSPSQP